MLYNMSFTHVQHVCSSFFLFSIFTLQVLHLYILLGIQNLLCLRLHAFSIRHSRNCHGMRNDCMHIFSTERRGL